MTVKAVTAYEDTGGGLHRTKEQAKAANRDTLLRSIVSRARYHTQQKVCDSYVAQPEDVLDYLLVHNADDLRKLLEYEERK